MAPGENLHLTCRLGTRLRSPGTHTHVSYSRWETRKDDDDNEDDDKSDGQCGITEVSILLRHR